MKRWTVGDVMRREVVTVDPATPLRRIADLLVAHRIPAAPVVDAAGLVVGIVGEADLLARLEYTDRVPHHALATRRLRDTREHRPGETAADLMSTPVITINAGASVAYAARLMEAARIKRLPVLDAAERLAGIVSRHDLMRPHSRPDEEIRTEIVDALRSVGVDAAQVAVRTDHGVVTLRGVVPYPDVAALVVGVAAAVPGVVDVCDELGRAVVSG